MFISSSRRRKRGEPNDLLLKIARLGDASLAGVSKPGPGEEEKHDEPANRHHNRKQHPPSDRKE
jgi:hypothetical protein